MEIHMDNTSEANLTGFFNDRIEEFNQLHWEVKKKYPLCLKIQNDSGEIVAGVASKTFGLWLLIENLWVHESCRGKDLGSKILLRMEAEALERGCQFALLDTLGFQARPFYEKHGYVLQWTQERYPRDSCKHFMVKNLVL